MTLDYLCYDLVVSTPTGAVLTTGVCVIGIIVIILQHTLLSDL